jgi:hypothetical protein
MTTFVVPPPCHCAASWHRVQWWQSIERQGWLRVHRYCQLCERPVGDLWFRAPRWMDGTYYADPPSLSWQDWRRVYRAWMVSSPQFISIIGSSTINEMQP